MYNNKNISNKYKIYMKILNLTIIKFFLIEKLRIERVKSKIFCIYSDELN